MKTILNVLLKLIAFVIAGALIVVLPVALVLNNAGDVLFDQEAVGGITTSVVLDSDLIPASMEILTNRQAEGISTKIEETDNPEVQELNLFNLIYSMEAENWKNFRSALLTDDLIWEWINSTVSGFFLWLDSDDQDPIILWNMSPLVDKMRGPEGEAAVVAYYDSLPDCTDLQMEEMQTQPGDPLPQGKMVKELCKLSTFPHTEQIKVYNTILGMVADATPPEYNLTQALLKDRGQPGGLYTLKWQIRSLRFDLDRVLLAPIVMLFLILVLGVRSLEGLGQWWGIPLVGGSMIALITSLLYRVVWTGILADRMPEAIPQTSLLYHELIAGSNRLIAPIFNPLRWQSFLILIIGVGLLAMGFILRVRGSGERR